MGHFLKPDEYHFIKSDLPTDAIEYQKMIANTEAVSPVK